MGGWLLPESCSSIHMPAVAVRQEEPFASFFLASFLPFSLHTPHLPIRPDPACLDARLVTLRTSTPSPRRKNQVCSGGDGRDYVGWSHKTHLRPVQTGLSVLRGRSKANIQARIQPAPRQQFEAKQTPSGKQNPREVVPPKAVCNLSTAHLKPPLISATIMISGELLLPRGSSGPRPRARCDSDLI